MVLVASAFRDAADYVDRYFDQIAALREHVPVTLHLAEGDSSDDSWDQIADRMTDGDWLYRIAHGGRKFKSVDHPERWNQIATVWNTLLDKIPQDGPLILVEADLIWQPDTMLTLLGHLGEGIDAVSPQSLANGGERFYDTWGYRWPSGEIFSHEPVDQGRGVLGISSAGSCIVMKPEVYRDARFGENDGIVGFCRDLHFKGYSLWLDPSVSVVHP